jgi:CHAT domain-containing protein/tetratricopeptide (TPR) repeat protein
MTYASSQTSSSGFNSTSRSPQELLSEANRLAWLFNWPRAEHLYAAAETKYRQQGDAVGEAAARIGRIRAGSGRMSFVEVSRLLGKELANPLVKKDPKLKLWCVAAKGYTDIEIDLAASRRDWTEAQAIAKSVSDSRWETRAAGELGIIAFLEGDSERAAEMTGKALLSAMASGDVGTEIRDFTLVGDGFNEVKRFAEALAFFDRAIRLANENPDSGFPFRAFEGKSRTLIQQNRLAEAQQMLNQALEVAKRTEQFGDQTEILVLLGELESRTGHTEQAINDWRQSVSLGTRYGWFHMVAKSAFDLSKLYRVSGDLQSADDFASIGVEASRRTGDGYFLPRDLTVLADLKVLRGRTAEANDLYSQAEDRIEEMLIRLPESYWTSSWAGAMGDTYLHHFELAAHMGRVDKALGVLERVRGRTAAATLERKSHMANDESPEGRMLEKKLSEVQLKLTHDANPTERATLEDQMLEYERRLSLASKPPIAEFERPATLRDVQNILGSDEAVLEYVLDDPRSYCLWISHDDAGIDLLPAGRQQIEKLTRLYLAEMRAKKDSIDPARKLSGILVEPIKVLHQSRLIVVPDGLLNLLPFDALYFNGRWLVESRVVSYAPASTVLQLLRQHNGSSSPPRSLLAVGDVVYENQGNAHAQVQKPEGLSGKLLRGLSDLLGTPLRDLPDTRKEVLGVGNIIGKDSVLLLGQDATETAVKQQHLVDYKILHFAVHGYADSQFPERSALILGVDPESGDDGLLQAREIMELHSNADLVVLSACNTGVGKLEGEEGVSSLAGAFLASGAKSVVASLWSAEDTYARIVMERFYIHLAAGEDKARALRDAKLDSLRQSGMQTSPYYWAPFVLLGDGGSAIVLNSH